MSTNGHSADGMADIIHALEVSHSPISSNALRKEALQFLESKKRDDLASRNGFLLASNPDNSPLVRHFGLSLLDHVLLHTGFAISSTQILELKEMVMQLAQGIQVHDPSYYRNKVAQLWAEVAKRSWGIDWNSMDQDLFNLWNGTALHKEFVLTVLETLSEDIFYREDTASSLRGTDLNRALVEIFTPLWVFHETFPEREHNQLEIRHLEDGWLSRICDFLVECIANVNTSREARECTLKSLAVLRTALVWSIPKAVLSCDVVAIICHAFESQNENILLAAIEALHSLYSRSNVEFNDFSPLLEQIYNLEHLVLLRKLYEWTAVDASDIDETQYQIAKKLSELISYVAAFLEDKDLDIQSAEGTDLPFFFEFTIAILRHQSLTVSIPVLHSWSRLLTAEGIERMEFVTRVIAPLLEICTQRLVRWENFPDDSEDPTILFLNEDIDTIPERHAFVGNYRRYCATVIEVIVQKRPHEAIPHILTGVDQNINNLYSGAQPFSVESFQKFSFPLMRADTQFSVVEATLKGYQKWIIVHGRSPQEHEQQRRELEQMIENWAMSLMQRSFEDPVLKQRVIKLVVDISAKALDNTPSFALKVLEHILMAHVEDRLQYSAYSDAVRELHSLASHELRRLSMRYADYFFTFYDVLEPKIREIAATHQLDDKLQTELISVLLIITQRTKNVDPRIREERLNSFIEPVRNAWQNEEFRTLSSTFGGFCELLGLEKVGPFMQSKAAADIEDWSSVLLDDTGKEIQEQMTKRFQQLPLRGTKTLFAVSTEKLKRTEPAYELGCALWRDVIPIILPTLLQLVGHAHAFHNPANWNNLSPDMRTVVSRILTDRFWQAGISTGSRDDFYAKITTSKATLEGFASSVRGKVRAVRESCYSMLFSMSRLRQYFYGFEELPGPLSEALFKDATHLSSHQFSILLNISRCLIDDCPVQFREHFLPPIISTLFKQVDQKVTEEWDKIEQRKAGLVEADLTEEMKDESILRQLTYSAVIMVASLLDPQRGDPDAVASDDPSAPQLPVSLANSMRHFVLSNPTILEPVFMFCTHALRMRDTRCGSIITRVIRSILSDFAPPVNTPTAATIREFISTEVLRACITSVHEPYFVDMQRDLATLIASIWVLYGSSTSTPRSVMLSLPGMDEQRVAYTETALMSSTSGRQQRALVLDLLEGLRGVSISEQGKILGTREERRKARSAMQQRYMSTAPAEMEGHQNTKVNIDDGPDLGGIADMFG